MPCSIQIHIRPAVQLLYKQRNSEITTIVYRLARDIGARVSDRFMYVSPGGETGTLLVLASMPSRLICGVNVETRRQADLTTTPAVAGFTGDSARNGIVRSAVQLQCQRSWMRWATTSAPIRAR